MTFIKIMNKTPSQHVAVCNGNEGYSLPNRARIATGDTDPGGGDCEIRNGIVFEDPTHSRSEGAKASIAIHIRILVRRGQPLPLGVSPRHMWWQFCTPRNFFPVQSEPHEYFVPCILYPLQDKGKSVENYYAQYIKGKWVVPANPTKFSSLRYF